MADYIYPSLARGLARQSIDLTGRIKVALVTAKYEPSPKHRCRDNITHEVKGLGYTEGGLLLTNNKVVDDGESVVFKADPAVWTTATITARGAIVYYSSGAGSKYDELICYCDFAADISSTNGPFTINWSDSGILVLNADTKG